MPEHSPLQTPRPRSGPPPQAPACVRDANAVIVGAGPCGLTAAIFLSQRGVRVTVLERTKDLTAFDVSRAYTQGIYGDGLRALQLLPELEQALVAHCVPPEHTSGVFFRPDGSVQRMVSVSSVQPKKLSMIRSLRSGHLAAFLETATKCDGVTIRTGVTVEDSAFQPDGAVALTVSSDGKRETITSRFVLACDGMNSSVLAALQCATAKQCHNADGTEPTTVHSKAGFGELSWKTSNSRLQRKTMIMEPGVAEVAYSDAALSPTPEQQAGTMLVCPSVDSGQPRRTFCDLMVFPLSLAHVALCGGRIGSVIAPPDSPVWRLRSVDDAYDYFAQGLPQLDLRRFVTRENMQRFVDGQASKYSDVRCPRSISARIGQPGADTDENGTDARSGGVFVLGDAAHSFPSELGLGLNAAVQDVGVLARLLDDMAGADTSCGALAEAYERERGRDVRALMFVCRFGNPYGFEHANPLLVALFRWNRNTRRKLHACLPRVFWPAVQSQVAGDVRFAVVRSRASATTRRMVVCGLGAGVMLAAAIVRGVRRRGEDHDGEA